MYKRQNYNPTFHTQPNYNVIAYLRRSTSNKQELSIQRQEDSAQDTITWNGFNPEEVTYFIESKSAYNWVKVADWKTTRNRTEFTRMLKEIDKSKDPVILLAYEDSRLSRNDIDTQEILDRLFWEYDKKKKKIHKIYFNGWETWTSDSNKWDIKQRLLDRYKESLKTGERSRKASLGQLRKWRYVYSTPRWINRLRKWESELTTNEEIPYIIKAWDMRANGKSKIVINQYLKNYWIVLNISFERFFQNTVYAWFWTDPESGEITKIHFKWWRAPISLDLFHRVQKTLIKNTGIKAVSKYGEKQMGDAIANLLKWEIDNKKAFSVEFPKWKYRSYKSNAYWKFNKSEIKILKDYLEQATPRIKLMTDKILILFILKRGVSDIEFRSKIQGILNECKWMSSLEESQHFIERLWILVNESNYVDTLLDELRMNNSSYVDDLSEMIRIYFEEVAKKNNLLDTDERDNLIQNIEKQIITKEESKKEVLKNAFKQGFTADVANDVIKDIDEEINELQAQINLLSESTDMEDFINRLPKILIKIFELSNRSLPQRDIESIKDDLLKLVELTTFELSVTTKKELKIKLFEGLENILNSNCTIWLPELDSNQWPTG